MSAGDVHRYDNAGRMLDADGKLIYDTEMNVHVGPKSDPTDSDRVKIVKSIVAMIGWLGTLVVVYLIVKMVMNA